MSNREILLNCCGKDDYGEPKSMVMVYCVNLFTNRAQEIADELVLTVPAVNIVRMLDQTLIDFTFDDPDDYEFLQLQGMLNKFLTPENSLDEGAGKVPCIVVTICPKDFNGSRYVTVLHASPSFFMSKRGNRPDTIRFTANSSRIKFFGVDTDAMDLISAEDEAYEELENGII